MHIIPWTTRLGLPTCLGGSLVGLCASRFPEVKVCHDESNRDAAEDDWASTSYYLYRDRAKKKDN